MESNQFKSLNSDQNNQLNTSKTPNQQEFKKNIQVSEFNEKTPSQLDILTKDYKKSNENDQHFKSLVKDCQEYNKPGLQLVDQRLYSNLDNSINQKIEQIQKQQDIFSKQLQQQLQNQEKLYDQNQKIIQKQKDFDEKYEILYQQVQQSQKIRIDQDFKDVKKLIYNAQSEIQDCLNQQMDLKNNFDKIQQETKNQIKFEIASLKFFQESPESIKSNIKQYSENLQNKYIQLKNDQQQIQTHFQSLIETILKETQSQMTINNKNKENISEFQLQQSYIESDLIKVVQMLQEHQQQIQEIYLDINGLKNH